MAESYYDSSWAADAVRDALKQAVEKELILIRMRSAPEAFSKSSFSKSHGISPESIRTLELAESDSSKLQSFAEELARIS